MSKYQMILAVCETHSISKAASKLNYTSPPSARRLRILKKSLAYLFSSVQSRGWNCCPAPRRSWTLCGSSARKKIKSPRLQPDLPAWKKAYPHRTIQSISYHWLPDILRDFSESYPNIRFELTVDGFSALKEKIQSDQLDCIFVSRYSVPDLPFIPLGSDELMLVTPLDHPLAEQLTVSLTDISGENFVLSSDGLDYETGKIFETNHITPKIQYQLNEETFDFAFTLTVE